MVDLLCMIMVKGHQRSFASIFFDMVLLCCCCCFLLSKVDFCCCFHNGGNFRGFYVFSVFLDFLMHKIILCT